ncbi:MAG: hypothetical protein ACHREM_00295 [Polyangiales bacterium]
MNPIAWTEMRSRYDWRRQWTTEVSHTTPSSWATLHFYVTIQKGFEHQPAQWCLTGTNIGHIQCFAGDVEIKDARLEDGLRLLREPLLLAGRVFDAQDQVARIAFAIFGIEPLTLTPELVGSHQRRAWIDTYAHRLRTATTAHEMYLYASFSIMGYRDALAHKDRERAAIESYWYYTFRAAARDLRRKAAMT